MKSNSNEHREHGLHHRGRGEAVLGGAPVLVALGEDGVALEDEEPGVGVGVEEAVEELLQRGVGRGALEFPRRDRALHAARRMELVHAAPQVYELGVCVRCCCCKTGEEETCEKTKNLHAALSFLMGRTLR